MLGVGGDAGAWTDAGFSGGDAIRIGETVIVPGAAAGTDLVGGLDGIDALDGLVLADEPEAVLGGRMADAAQLGSHPNGVTAIDHVVVMTPDCDRTTAAFEAAGLAARRMRLIETPDGARRQTFFWMGDVICELVGPDKKNGDGPARWWGLALTVQDLDATVTMLGEHVSTPKPAVQPGRRVATLRKSIGIELPILLISPHVKA